MSENWSLQVSVKTAKDTLVNVRADNPGDLQAKLDWLTANANLVHDAENALRVIEAAQGFAAPVASQSPPPQQSWGQQGTQQSQAPAAPAGPAPSCVHGAMTFREGMGKNGKPWKAYFCPAPKGSAQCEAQWLR